MAHAFLTRSGPAGLARMARFATLGAGLALAGCFVVIDPGEVVETPAVNGVLTKDGAPVPGALLWISAVQARDPCEALRLSVRTDPAGTFAFAETRRHRTFEFVPLAPSTPGYTVQVCLDAGAGPRPLYRETFPGALPRHVDLQCDLAQDAAAWPSCTATFTGRQVPGYRGIH